MIKRVMGKLIVLTPDCASWFTIFLFPVNKTINAFPLYFCLENNREINTSRGENCICVCLRLWLDYYRRQRILYQHLVLLKRLNSANQAVINCVNNFPEKNGIIADRAFLGFTFHYKGMHNTKLCKMTSNSQNYITTYNFVIKFVYNIN